MTSTELRERYLAFFEARGHVRVPSDSLIPGNDPTLLFTSAGMVQFKPLYVAKDRPYARATSSQRCLRTTDIDRVGLTRRHLTFFEMLGNFSFGDYFKQETIAWAWEFLTKELGLDPARLHPSVFEKDDEAEGMWARIVPASRIVRFGDEDNYWPAGSALKTWVGPNGPCSEIYYDFGEAACGHAVKCIRPGQHEEHCERFRETWNLVFPQFIRSADGNNPTMAAPGIDTGMGLDRLTAVMQEKDSVYETDLFAPLMARGLALLGAPGDGAAVVTAQRILADHARAATFMVSDGIIPSNEGRGYVLRRLIRRAVRQSALFGDAKPVVSELVRPIVEKLGTAYPEIREREAAIRASLRQEEEIFIATLERGLAELRKERDAGHRTLGGERAFFFYDTFGFPRELTEDIWVREFKLVLTPSFGDEYAKALEGQQGRARAAWKGSGERGVGEIHHALARELGPTPFVGYDRLAADARVVAVVLGGSRVAAVRAGETAEIVLDKTPLYAESGGQVADHGRLAAPGGTAAVLDVQKPLAGMFLHKVRVADGEVREGMTVRAEVDAERRAASARHHTATHLLHAALHRFVGKQATQAGSLVAPDRLRFDFMSGKAVEPDALRAIGELVNAKVLENLAVTTAETTLDEAKRRGAMALFGEKYGDRVRLVEIGDFSRELCGGTHVAATGGIGPFLVAAEGAVAAGVRRIEALAGAPALAALAARADQLERTAALLKCAPQDLERRVQRLLEEQRTLERELAAAKTRAATGALASSLERVESVGGVDVVIAEAPAAEPAVLRELADRALDRLKEGVVVLGGRDADRCHLVVRVSAKVAERVKAADVVKAAAAAVGGSGGGKAEMAQAGGKEPAKLPDAFARAREYLAGELSKTPA